MICKCSRDKSRHSTAPSHIRKSKLALKAKVKVKALLPDDGALTKQPAEYSPSREELRTHISLHIAAIKTLLAGDPELNSVYQHCDNFLHTIQKAFEEEAARATNAVLANPPAGTTRQGWSDP